MPGFCTDTKENTKRWAVMISGEIRKIKMRRHLGLRGGRSECVVTRRLSQTAEQHSASVNSSIRRLIDRRKHVTSFATNPILYRKLKTFVAYRDKWREDGEKKQYGRPQKCASITRLQTARRVSDLDDCNIELSSLSVASMASAEGGI
jgi:hypothetical protein